MNIKYIFTSTSHSVIFGTSLVINSRSRKDIIAGPRTVREHFIFNIFSGIIFNFLENVLQVRPKNDAYTQIRMRRRVLEPRNGLNRL